MVEEIEIDGQEHKNRPVKRKRSNLYSFTQTPDEKLDKINKLRSEIDSLVNYFKELVSKRTFLEPNGNVSFNCLVACLMEESCLPLSKLVDEIFEKIKGKFGDLGDGVSKASVKSSVIAIGQRLFYGVVNVDADVLEDEAECALWCWETRELKLIPKVSRNSVKVRRTCRKKIQERINAILAMVTALEKSDVNQNQQKELLKSSEKLAKVLDEADIRLLLQNMLQKNDAEMAEVEPVKEEKMLIKQMEKSKMNIEKERKKKARQLQMEEELQNKQLKKKQQELEKEQRRKKKEEAELKRQLAAQKQASIMERFLKQSKPTSTPKNHTSMKQTDAAQSSSNISERMSVSATLTMDSVLAQTYEADSETMLKLHLNSWKCARKSRNLSRERHWGLRQKPKTKLVKELKLTTNNELNCVEDYIEKNLDEQKLSQTSSDNPVCSSQKRKRSMQLLQFDKCYRPAFYGVWRRNNQTVGARRPFARDPDINYEIDSDEEWEEEEPGENLSDCDKEDEDGNAEDLNGDDEDESDDGFLVQDGYLSENEGVHGVELDSDEVIDEVRDLPDSQKQEKHEEFCTLLRQQKYLNKLTDLALKKDKPLIILNLMHEKNMSVPAEELTDKAKIEQMCLQTLCIRPVPGFPDMAIQNMNNFENKETESPRNKLIKESFSLQDSDLPQIISVIQSCQQSIGKIVELLHKIFPAISKSELGNKVREISEYSDNRWQVKKEILRKLGLTVSPAKNSIAAFMKKTVPPGKTMNFGEKSSHGDC